MKLRIAARKSDLARLQAYTVGRALQARMPLLEIEYFFSASLGDKNLTDPLWKMPEKGVFTQDLTRSLLQNECDLVVHSWKDLPVEDHPETTIVATMPREDARDLLLLRKDSVGKKNLTILSSSPRREFNNGPFINSVLPWANELKFLSVRGNIPTRVEKLRAQSGDGLLVAKAALDRLLGSQEDEFSEVRLNLRDAFREFLWMVLPLSQCPTAAAQGALAVEILNSRSDLRPVLKNIHCDKTFQAVLRERQILKSHGGGCHQKIGISIFNHVHGQVLSLRGKTEQGILLEEYCLQANENSVLTNQNKKGLPAKELLDAEIFPKNMTENNFFDTEPVSYNSSIFQKADLFVAKHSAWPVNLKVNSEQVIWAAGVRTWRMLAQKGVWVNGCLDSLGESASPNVEMLSGRSAQFMKLTHQEAAHDEALPGAWIQTTVGTYKLVANQNFPDLKNVKQFYWTSYSHFKAALERYPSIRDAEHACGAGKTYELISNALGKSASLRVFLSQKSWLESLRKNKF